jgi:DNA invertase Pin-like site-specific DNA recombinase
MDKENTRLNNFNNDINPDYANPDYIWDYAEYTSQCLALQPNAARKYSNGVRRKLCVAPTVYNMRLANGRLWHADGSLLPRGAYARVSSPSQRSPEDFITGDSDAADNTSGLGRAGDDETDGWGELTQISKIISYCTTVSGTIDSNAGRFPPFRIYSDCGLSGRLPSDDIEMAQRANDLHATRYDRLYRAVWLDETYLSKCPQGQRERHLDYLADHLDKLRSGYRLDTKSNLQASQKKRVNQPFVNYRPGISELLRDVRQKTICEIPVTDMSRLSRNAVFIQAIAEEFVNNRVAVTGLIQDLSYMSNSNLAADIVKAVFAIMAQFRIDEVLQGYFQGVQEHLLAGKPLAQTPAWLKTNGKKPAQLIESKVDIVREVIKVFMDITDGVDSNEWQSAGIGTVAKRLDELNIPVMREGVNRVRNEWCATSVKGILENPALIGRQCFFGCDWETLPRLIENELYDEIQARLHAKAGAHAKHRKGGRTAETAYLGSEIMVCVCGKTMIHAAFERSYNCKMKRLTSERGVEHHVSLKIDNVHNFLNVYVQQNSESIVMAFRDSVDRRHLEQKEAEIRAKFRAAKERLLPEKAAAEHKVREDMQDLKPYLKTENAIAAAVNELLAPLLQQIDNLEQQAKDVNTALKLPINNTDVDDIQTRIAEWSRLSDDAKNANIHRVFQGFYAKGEPGKETFTPILKTASGLELPPIPLASSKRWGTGWARLLPETTEQLAEAEGRSFDF